MVTMNVAVVPHPPHLIAGDAARSDLTKVTAALQVQVTRDFTPIWGVTATVTPFLSLEDVPTGYLALVLAASLPGDGHGVHYAAGGRPFALAKYASLVDPGNWSVMASHELLEMLVDPWGNRVISGGSLEDDQGQVEYLLEICDPCQKLTYLIDGVLVSDFVTPDYYSPRWTKDLRYSFTGKISGPRVVADGGYITWREPGTEKIYQQRGPRTGHNRQAELTGGGPLAALSLREWVDSHEAPADDAGPTSLTDPEFPDPETLAEAKEAYRRAANAAKRYGGALARDIARLLPADGDRRLDVADFIAALGRSHDLYQTYVDPDRGPRAALDTFRAEAEKSGYEVAIDRDAVPERLTNPAKRDVFGWVAERLKDGGDIFGDGLYTQGGPRWWLRALGGG